VTVYNQSQLAERKHVARYWWINNAVTAVSLIGHPSPIEVAADEISGNHIGRGVVRRKCSAGPVLPLFDKHILFEHQTELGLFTDLRN